MQQHALVEARVRLLRAKTAVVNLEKCSGFSDFETVWVNFLHASNAIYTKLQKGSRDGLKSKGWFERKEHERKTDPLLSYLHQARNVEEHGLEPLAELDPGGIGIRGNGTVTGYIGGAYFNNVTFGSSMKDDPLQISLRSPTAKLLPVRCGRSGRTFDPPTEHMGSMLHGTSPLDIAKAALQHHTLLIDEAGKFSPGE